MIDYDKMLCYIEDGEVDTLKRKDLIEFGFNDYYLKKAIKDGRIRKEKQGTYIIAKIEKKNLEHTFFSKFRKAIKSSNYEAAYEDYKRCLSYHVGHDYDNNYRIYGLLLQEILGDSYDFSFLDDLWEFCSYSNSGNETLEKFRNFVMEKDFKTAYGLLNQMITKAVLNEVTYSNFVLICSIMLKSILNNQVYIPKNPVFKDSFQKCCVILNEMLQEEDYEKAFNFLNDKKSSFQKCSDIYYFHLILSTFMQMRENSSTLTLYDNSSYEKFGDDCFQIFWQSLKAGDYLTSYQNIGKCIYHDSENSKLKIYHKLLQMVVELNKKNIQKQQNITSPKSSKSDFSDISSLIYDRKYEEAYLNLKGYCENCPNDKTANTLKKLMHYYYNFQNGFWIYQNRKHDYVYSSEAIFKRFFEALRCQDFYEAYECGKICQEIVRRRNEFDFSFDLYLVVLDDILQVIEYQQRMAQIDEALNKFIYKIPFSMWDLSILYEILNTKYSLCEKEEEKLYISYALNLLETIQMMQQVSIGENDFEDFPSIHDDLLSNFLDAMKIGNYIGASKIIFNECFIEQTNQNPYKNYFILFKKMLRRFHMHLKSYSWSSLKSEPTFENNVLYSRLSRFIKHRNFDGAYEFYQLHFHEFSEELQKDLDVFFCQIFLIRKSLLDVSFEFSSLNRLKSLEYE